MSPPTRSPATAAPVCNLAWRALSSRRTGRSGCREQAWELTAQQPVTIWLLYGTSIGGLLLRPTLAFWLLGEPDPFRDPWRGVHLQSQFPWALMTPLLYGLAIHTKPRWPHEPK